MLLRAVTLGVVLSCLQGPLWAEEALPLSFENEFNISYQNSFQLFRQKEAALEGWRANQLRARGQLIWDEWLVTASLIGDRSEVELEGFYSNPVFSFDSFSGELSVSRIWWRNPKWALASGVSYSYQSYHPENTDQHGSPVPYTNSTLDYAFNTQGPGVFSLARFEWFPGWHWVAQASVYPFLWSAVEKGPDLGYLGRLGGQLRLEHQLMPGFLLSTFVHQTLWVGSFFEGQSTLGIGLTLVPEQIEDP